MNMTMSAADVRRRQVLSTFSDDIPGIRLRATVGVEDMWVSDLPHAGSTWPHSCVAIAENLAGVPDDERALILGVNLARLYGLG